MKTDEIMAKIKAAYDAKPTALNGYKLNVWAELRAVIEAALKEREAPPKAQPMEPFLLGDLSHELGVAVPILSQQIASNGLGDYSTNMALPIHVASAMRKIYAHQTEAFARAPKAQPMSDALLDKKANTGPIYAPGGIVSRTPVSYRVELQNHFKAGFRAAERHHNITGE